VIGIPFIFWASIGFPDGDSHGLWMSLMIGVPVGAILGLFLGLISTIFPKIKPAKNENHGAKPVVTDNDLGRWAK
jgi:hypothetical protein